MKAACCFVLSRQVIDSSLGAIRFFVITGLFPWSFLRIHDFKTVMFIRLKKVILMTVLDQVSF